MLTCPVYILLLTLLQLTLRAGSMVLEQFLLKGILCTAVVFNGVHNLSQKHICGFRALCQPSKSSKDFLYDLEILKTLTSLLSITYRFAEAYHIPLKCCS